MDGGGLLSCRLLILKHFGWMIPVQWHQLKLDASQHLHRTVDTADAGSPPSDAEQSGGTVLREAAGGDETPSHKHEECG